MSEEMRLVLSKLDKMDNDMQEMKTDIRELKADVQVLKDDVQVLKDDVQGLKDDVEKLKPLEGKFDHLAMLVETEVRRMVNVVAEGHGILHKRMKDVIDLYEDKEQMKVEIISLRIDVKNIKRAVAIV